jgi:septum formation protein
VKGGDVRRSMAKKLKIILASSSPRRKYLLQMLLGNFGLKFEVIPANIEEYFPEKISRIDSFTENLAYMKAKDVSQKYKGIVIGADTIVVLGGKIMGKPVNKRDAVKMLKGLSGKSHKVYTGVAIIDSVKNTAHKFHEVTSVKFRKLLSKEINFYVNSGSPMDKAGAYGIQDDFGSIFIEKIDGDYFNVVGLPVVKTYLVLKKILGIKL